jgi:hypothetical protein
MLAKRKFQNFVNTYSDQSIGGKKTFTENLVVTGECTLPDNTNLKITFDNSSISQSAIISTTGWIYDAFTELIGSVSDLVDDLNNNTFGYLTSSDTISQNQIDETTENGWISAIYTGLTAILAPKYSPTFTGEMTFPDGKIISQTEDDTTFWSDVTFKNTVTFPNEAISQSAIWFSDPDGWFTLTLNEIVDLIDNKVEKYNPIFEGTVTFVDTSVMPNTSTTITDYLKSSTAASTYAPKASPTFTGTVTFPDASVITDYLKSTTAASTYLTTSSAASTYAPKASPTFTGTISLNGDVTLASASANTITLNDHLVLCTGPNFTTPVSGQQGYIINGTFETDFLSIASAVAIKYATLNLTYGVWLIIGQIGYHNANATAASISIKWHTISTSVTTSLLYGTRINATNTIGTGIENHETLSRVVTVTSASQAYYLVAYIAYSGGTLTTYNSSSLFYAVRIA